jgi:hypothetical protein
MSASDPGPAPPLTLADLLDPGASDVLPLSYPHTKYVPPSSALIIKAVPCPAYRSEEYVCFDDVKPVSKCFGPAR